MPSSAGWFASLMLLLLAALAPLTGLSIDDWRLQYSVSGGRAFSSGGTVDVNSTTGGSNSFEQHVDSDADSHVRRALVYRRSLHELRDSYGSFVWGLEFADDVVKEHQGNISYRGRSEMVDLFVGWAWRLTPRWHVEEGALVGIGRSRWGQDIAGYYPDGADWSDESEGFTSEYGIDLATYYSFDSHWQIGVDLRHLVMDSHTRFIDQHVSTDQVNDPGDITSSSANWKFTVQGFNLSGGIGYRF